MKNRKNKKGFTIVELVIVIGVIGILSAILIPTFVSLTAKAEAARDESNASNAYSMYVAIAADNKVESDEIEGAAGAAILLKGQKDVELVKDGKVWTYSLESNKWVGAAGSATGTLVASASVAPATNTAEQNSTFGGYVVYYK